jgi:hypothetical protein
VVNYGILSVSTNAVLNSIISESGTVELFGENIIEECTFSSTCVSEPNSKEGKGEVAFTATHSEFSFGVVSATNITFADCVFSSVEIKTTKASCSSCSGSSALFDSLTLTLEDSSFTDLILTNTDLSATAQHSLSDLQLLGAQIKGNVNVTVDSLYFLCPDDDDDEEEEEDSTALAQLVINEEVILNGNGKFHACDGNNLITNNGGQFLFSGTSMAVNYKQEGATATSVFDSSVLKVGDAFINSGNIIITKTLGAFTGNVVIGESATLSFQDTPEVPLPSSVSGTAFRLEANSTSLFSLFSSSSSDLLTAGVFTHEEGAALALRFEDEFVPSIGDEFTLIRFSESLSTETDLFSYTSVGVDARALSVVYYPKGAGANVTVYVLGCPEGYHSEPITQCVAIEADSSASVSVSSSSGSVSEATTQVIVIPKWPPFVFLLFLGLMLFFLQRKGDEAKLPAFVLQKLSEIQKNLEGQYYYSPIKQQTEQEALPFRNADGVCGEEPSEDQSDVESIPYGFEEIDFLSDDDCDDDDDDDESTVDDDEDDVDERSDDSVSELSSSDEEDNAFEGKEEESDDNETQAEFIPLDDLFVIQRTYGTRTVDFRNIDLSTGKVLSRKEKEAEREQSRHHQLTNENNMEESFLGSESGSCSSSSSSSSSISSLSSSCSESEEESEEESEDVPKELRAPSLPVFDSEKIPNLLKSSAQSRQLSFARSNFVNEFDHLNQFKKGLKLPVDLEEANDALMETMVASITKAAETLAEQRKALEQDQLSFKIEQRRQRKLKQLLENNNMELTESQAMKILGGSHIDDILISGLNFRDTGLPLKYMKSQLEKGENNLVPSGYVY